MTWKWYDFTSYIAEVGGGGYYGQVQLLGTNFYAVLSFMKTGPLPAAYTTVVAGQQRFYGTMDFQQMPVVVDLLRNEQPVRFGWDDAKPDQFQLRTGPEPVGEADGVLAEVATA